MPTPFSIRGMSLLVLASLCLPACGPKDETEIQAGTDQQEKAPPAPGEPGYETVSVVKQPTPLHRALQAGDLDTARKLLEEGADPSASLDDGLAPIHIAAGHGFKDLVELLIERGADLSARQAKGGTALHIAIAGNRVEIAQLLLDHGADPFVADDLGETPLHAAVRVNDLVTAKRLVEIGADINQKNKFGGSALMIAETDGKKQMVDVLKNTQPKGGAAPGGEPGG